MEVEQILPGIYLSLHEDIWTPDKLRSHGFTHIIRIDKHIAQTANDFNSNTLPILSSPFASTTAPTRNANYQHHHSQRGTSLDGFDTLDLNFGAASYLTTVLPNCYKAVKFIDKALQNGGAVLIIDRHNNEKCITIVVGYLMYKKEIKFSNAFQLVKQIHPNLELDKFYKTQLHEYEPILQVQRTFSYGNSCSRELRSSALKRKQQQVSYDDLQMTAVDCTVTTLPISVKTTIAAAKQCTRNCSLWSEENCVHHHFDNSDVLME